MQDDNRAPMKVVGRKTSTTGLEAANRLQQTMIALRRGKPFLPRGVHRFKTHEEAWEWTLRMLTRR